MRDIELVYKGEIHRIPNNWEDMTEQQFVSLVTDLLAMAAGKLSAGEVRINHLCRIMKWQKRRFRTEEQVANLVAISEQLTFLFLIQYPDNNEVLEGMNKETYELCRRVDPFRLNIPIARVLRRLEYQYVVDLCFCAQLIQPHLPRLQNTERIWHTYMLAHSTTIHRSTLANRTRRKVAPTNSSHTLLSRKGIQLRTCPRTGKRI